MPTLGHLRLHGVIQRFTHVQDVTIRLGFLTFVLTNSSLTLGEEQVSKVEGIGSQSRAETNFEAACSVYLRRGFGGSWTQPKG